jgi:hypothetical protein
MAQQQQPPGTMPAPNPFLVIRNVAPEITTFSVPFLRFNKIKFGGRATLVRLSTGSLAIFSPVPLSPDVSSTISNLGGNLRYIVAPDIEHHMQLGPYKNAYPAATVIGPEGLREKRAKQGDQDVVIDYEFNKANKRQLKLPDELMQEFEVEYWDGHASKELAFLHKPSRTLIEADLLFNLPAREQYSMSGEDPTKGVFTKLMSYFTNTRVGHKGQQRFLW